MFIVLDWSFSWQQSNSYIMFLFLIGIYDSEDKILYLLREKKK